MIPGAVNIPWTQLSPATPGDAGHKTLTGRLGARFANGNWDFSAAKTVVMYCNGSWCSQSTSAVTALLKVGYPRERLKWYRGGMQAWEVLGLTTVKGP
jgi:3-mercaptopyruvate sulfurtransferase SseA